MEAKWVKKTNLTFVRMRNDILYHGCLCCILYVSFLFGMKLLGLEKITELRFVNYLILTIAAYYQVKKWMSLTHSFVPFLEVFSSVFFTGIWSFILFCVFLFVHNKYDPDFAQLFVRPAQGMFPAFPSVVVMIEGSGATMVIAFVLMQYFRRYEEGEFSVE